MSIASKPLWQRPDALFMLLLPVLLTESRAIADVTASLSAIGGLVWLWRHPGERHFRAPWFGAVLLLWTYMMLVAGPLAISPVAAWKESLAFMRWPLFALCLVLVFFRRPERLRWFETGALVWCGFIMLDSLFQYGMGVDVFGIHRLEMIRLTGPFSKNVPGIYSLRLYPVALVGLLALLQGERARWRAHALLAFMLLAELFAFLSGERIVFLMFSLINAVVAISVVFVLRPSRWLVGGGLLGLLGGALGVALFAQNMVARTVGKFVQQMNDFQHTDYYDIFHAALVLWQRFPWTGVGTRYYSAACLQFHQESHMEGCVVHPHNIYLQWLSENGIIGLVLFLLFLFLFFRQVLRGLDFRREPLLAVVVVLAPFAVFWPVMTSMSMFANNYAQLVWLTVAWALARSAQPRLGGG